MKYKINRRQVNYTISTKNNLISWSANGIYTAGVYSSKITETESECPLEILQMYLATISEARGDAIILKLKEIKRYFDMFLNGNGLAFTVRGFIESLMNMPGLRPPELLKWVQDNIEIPEKLNANFNQEDNPSFKLETTYLKHEYPDLVVLALYSKFLAPIYAAFMESVKDTAIIIEVECLTILPNIMKHLPGYIKLSAYVYHTQVGFKQNQELLLKRDIDSEMKQDWIFSLMITKRLISSKILHKPGNACLVTYIYTYIRNKCKSESSKTYMDKKIGSSGGASDEELSGVYDSYRFKDAIPMSHKAEMVFCSSREYLLPFLRDQIDLVEFNRISEHFVKEQPVINELHIILAKWVMYKVLPTPTFYLLDRFKMYDIMILSHLLLKKNHEFMSLLMLSSVIYDMDGEPELPMDVHRTRLVLAETELLKKKFPIYKSGSKPKYHVLELVQNIYKKMLFCWKLNLPGKNTGVYVNTIQNRLEIPAHGKQLIMKLILDCDNLITLREKGN
jgi:hypothetical protein